MSGGRTRKVLLAVSIVFLLVALASLALIFKVFPDELTGELNEGTGLRNSSDDYENFVTLPFAVNFSVYIFTVQNPMEILLHGSKPILKQVGPYVYDLYRSRNIQQVLIDEDLITYYENETLEFNRKASGGRHESNYVTVLNPAMMGILENVDAGGFPSRLSDCLQEMFRTFTDYHGLFVNITVKELLFEGINFCDIPFGSSCYRDTYLACSQMSWDSIKRVPYIDGALNGRYFSFLNHRSGVGDDLFAVSRGLIDRNNLGQIIRLNNQTYNSIWNKRESTICDKVLGTDLTLFPPQLSKSSMITYYSTYICRNINFTYNNEQSYKGINGYTFTPILSTFKDHEGCFCPNKTIDWDGQKNCYLDGVIDMQPCKVLPILLSFPHFLRADQKYVKNLDGVKPQEELHESFVTIDPITGTTLQLITRFQLNMVVRPINGVDFTAKMPRVLLPLIWIEENYSLSEEGIKDLEVKYYFKAAELENIQWSVTGASSLLFLAFGGIFGVMHFVKRGRRSAGRQEPGETDQQMDEINGKEQGAAQEVPAVGEVNEEEAASGEPIELQEIRISGLNDRQTVEEEV